MTLVLITVVATTMILVTMATVPGAPDQVGMLGVTVRVRVRVRAMGSLGRRAGGQRGYKEAVRSQSKSENVIGSVAVNGSISGNGSGSVNGSVNGSGSGSGSEGESEELGVETGAQQAAHAACALPLLRAAADPRPPPGAPPHALPLRGRPDLASLTAATWPLGPEGPKAVGVPPTTPPAKPRLLRRLSSPLTPVCARQRWAHLGKAGSGSAESTMGVCNRARPPVVVSIGSRGDVSFERGVFSLFHSKAYTLTPSCQKRWTRQ